MVASWSKVIKTAEMRLKEVDDCKQVITPYRRHRQPRHRGVHGPASRVVHSIVTLSSAVHFILQYRTVSQNAFNPIDDGSFIWDPVV